MKRPSIALVLAVATAWLPAPAARGVDGTLAGGALPIWQTNGTVYALAHASGVVFAGGDFTSVRPPAAQPGTDEVARNFLAAFDAATGELLPFAPALNGAVRALALAPDGSRLYVGGGFTIVDGLARVRLAAFDTATGTLTAGWNVPAEGTVLALAAVGTTLYAGGLFTGLGGEPRQRLAALSDAGRLLPWAPVSDAGVYAIAASPAEDRVVVGGAFDTVNGESWHAVASLDPATGETQPWAAASVPPCSVVKAIVTDGTAMFFGNEGREHGCFDGTWAASPSDGSLVWESSCGGATQALAAIGNEVYLGSHHDDCSGAPGGFPVTPPGGAYHLLAQSRVDGSFRHWFPNTNGNNLGPRAMTSDGTQLFVGGDFTTVNKRGQQGLARFGPVDNTRPARPARPAVASTTRGTVFVSWQTVVDLDDSRLAYELFRDDRRKPIAVVREPSKPWSRPVLVFEDTGREPGSTHTYRVTASDGTFSSYSSERSASVTVASAPAPYADAVAGGAPSLWWRLNDTDFTAADASGNANDGTYTSGTRHRASGAINGDAAVILDGRRGLVYSNPAFVDPGPFSLELWIRTTTTSGGWIVGLSDAQTGAGAAHDRHLYMTDEGRLVFGTNPGTLQTVATLTPYNDGVWHQVVATFGTNGMALYVDGSYEGANANSKTRSLTGYWRIGGDVLAGWPAAPASDYFKGSVDEFAYYPRALGGAEVAAHFAAR